ncbi:type II toxin-antitoxin system PrlF family antitoxin [Geitlerinema sp. P-1104]|uniref:type II toxin-antitoxin system PrlF family antitoxin n=1 Tax=Geitlerinema sp. P-1104 TaxID=2546230 RepID=UPI0014771725|nr:type II toxin-antitoxin system PrlF family antitoxin [Geitlerinema sp. P-1104]NMG59156.1 type II toxin-antitoxin system PrlF family antitoxin [Geitlerinema sp. P-1104]
MARPSKPCSESTLTARYQTTIPEPIRKFLGLAKGDKIQYSIESDGQVLISVAKDDDDDPILGAFLEFLEQDMAKNPQKLQPVPANLVNRVQSLVAGVDVSLDEPLADEDE